MAQETQQTPSPRWEYDNIGIPKLVLKEDRSASIKRVDLYTSGDYFREYRRSQVEEATSDVSFSLPIDHSQAYNFFRDSSNTIPKTLEECTDAQIALLSTLSIPSRKKFKLPIDELIELRRIEIQLRQEHGDYRKRLPFI